MRAFVALVPPADARAELAAAVEPVRAAWPGLRWTPAEQWHLTLAFLGEIDGERVLPDLTARLARAALRHPPQHLVFTGAGRFGDRVLWTRVHAAPRVLRPGTRVPRSRTAGSASRLGSLDGLRALAASVAAAARRCRIPMGDRPYRPHLTLARSRSGADLRPPVAAMQDFAGTPWTADALHLVQSRLGAGPDGTAAHDVVASWPLG